MELQEVFKLLADTPVTVLALIVALVALLVVYKVIKLKHDKDE